MKLRLSFQKATALYLLRFIWDVFVAPQSIYPKIKFLLQFQPNRQTTYHKILKYIETMLHMIQDVYKLYCTEWHGLGYQTK